MCEFHVFTSIAGERLSVMENPFRGELPRALGVYGVSLSEIGGYSVSVESVAESECESVANFMDVIPPFPLPQDATICRLLDKK